MVPTDLGYGPANIGDATSALFHVGEMLPVDFGHGPAKINNATLAFCHVDEMGPARHHTFVVDPGHAKPIRVVPSLEGHVGIFLLKLWQYPRRSKGASEAQKKHF